MPDVRGGGPRWRLRRRSTLAWTPDLSDARPEDRHPVAAGVGGERLRRVEAHRLGGEQPRVERRGVVDLEPRRGVDEVGERERVGLREAEVRERLELLEDLLRDVGLDPLARHPLHRPPRSASIRSG